MKKTSPYTAIVGMIAGVIGIITFFGSDMRPAFAKDIIRMKVEIYGKVNTLEVNQLKASVDINGILLHLSQKDRLALQVEMRKAESSGIGVPSEFYDYELKINQDIDRLRNEIDAAMDHIINKSSDKPRD